MISPSHWVPGLLHMQRIKHGCESRVPSSHRCIWACLHLAFLRPKYADSLDNYELSNIPWESCTYSFIHSYKYNRKRGHSVQRHFKYEMLHLNYTLPKTCNLDNIVKNLIRWGMQIFMDHHIQSSISIIY